MSNTWVGVRVRKGDGYGTVVHDYNYTHRILSIKMDDGTDAEIVMNNVGPDPNPEILKEWEWFWDKTDDKKWIRF